MALYWLAPGEALADDDTATNRYRSLRATVYSNRFSTLGEDEYGARLKIRLSASVHKFKSLDEFMDPDIRRFQSYGVRPKIEFELPTRWRKFSFLPAFELQLTRQEELRKTLFSGAVTGTLRYRSKLEHSQFVFDSAIKYGTRYDEDGVNFSDYLKLSVKADFPVKLDWSIGRRALEVTPYLSASYFVDELRAGFVDDLVNVVDEQYEIGLSFSTQPRIRLWQVRFPKVHISFTYGDDAKGIKIRF